MKVKIQDKAEEDLGKMDNATYDLFNQHIDKIAAIPSRRHLKFGMPFSVEEVGQGRIVYNIKENTPYIIRCFTPYKDYVKWYKSFK